MLKIIAEVLQSQFLYEGGVGPIVTRDINLGTNMIFLENTPEVISNCRLTSTYLLRR